LIISSVSLKYVPSDCHNIVRQWAQRSWTLYRTLESLCSY